MVDVGIYCKYANIATRAGSRCSATSNAVAWTDLIVLDVESIINVMTRKNWSDVYSDLNADVKYILMDCAANLCAMYVIQYDMSGMTSREAETRLDLLYNAFMRDIKVLEDKNATQTFMTGA